MVLRADTRPSANSVGFLAAMKLPRPLTEACHRSSILAASALSGSGQALLPLVSAARSLGVLGGGVSVPWGPRDRVKVLMFCQNDGLVLVVRMLLVRSLRRSRFQ